MNRYFLTCLTASLLLCSPAFAWRATVGSPAGGCQYWGPNAIQHAIDDGATEIMITNTEAITGNTVIDGRRISRLLIAGGYQTCAQAAYDGHPYADASILDAQGFDSVLTITQLRPGSRVHLRRLRIQNGIGEADKAGGVTLMHNEPGSRLIVQDSTIINNHGLFGGGMALRHDHSNIILANSTIENNTAWNGGGLYCADGHNRIQVYGRQTLSNNYAIGSATEHGHGGAAFVAGSCQLALTANRRDGAHFTNNISTAHGGALYLTENAALTNSVCHTCPKPVFAGNRADGNNTGIGQGGAIYIHQNANTNIHNMLFSDNSADTGGAVAHTGLQHISITESTFESNSADTGGALFIGENAEAELVHSSLRFNQANQGDAIALQGKTRQTKLTVLASLIANNGDPNTTRRSLGIFSIQNTGGNASVPGPHLDLVQTTIADNVRANVTFNTSGGW